MKCKECGSIIKLQFSNSVNKELGLKNLCYDCNFWDEVSDELNAYEKTLCVSEGYVYRACEPTKIDKEKGFGGRKFQIDWNDGSSLVTDNLFSIGKVPEHYKNRITCNSSIRRI